MIHLILVLLSAPALCYGIMFKCFLIGNIIHFLQHGKFLGLAPKGWKSSRPRRKALR